MKSVEIGGLAGLIAILAAFSLTMANGFYLVIGFAVLIFIIVANWRLYIPNVFTFMMVFHWAQVFTYIYYINSSWKGDMHFLTNSSGSAYLYALTGLVVMSVVFFKVAYKNLEVSPLAIKDALEKIKPKKVLYLYIILYVLSGVLSRSAFAFGGLTQVFFNIALLKWAGFVLLGYIAFYNKEYRLIFALAFLMEFLAGFLSFFSTFKDVFFYTAIVFMTFITRINFNVSFKASLGLIALFYLAVFWTVIKGDYRQFLNEGSKQQVVKVSDDKAFDKLTDLVTTVDQNKISEGIGQFFYRLQYVYHLSKTIDMVPANMPYQNGSVWAETLQFIAVPRFLNPNKGIYNASIKATKFTGIQYLGTEQGVSFSLGYFADCYVDFGVPGMFIALALIAFIWSKIFRYFLINSSTNILVNYSIVTAYFIQFCFFEMDGTFMFGRMFTTFIVFIALKYTVFTRMEKFITT